MEQQLAGSSRPHLKGVEDWPEIIEFLGALQIDPGEQPTADGMGATLMHAMRLHCPEGWNAIRVAFDDPHGGGRWVTAFEKAQSDLWKQISSGALFMTGLHAGLSPERIDPMMLELPLNGLNPDSVIAWRICAMAESILEGPEITVRCVRVFPSQKPQVRVASAAEIKKWFLEKKKSGYVWRNNESALKDARRDIGAIVSKKRFLGAKKLHGRTLWKKAGNNVKSVK